MSDEQRYWLYSPCYYVTAYKRQRQISLLAGPYRTRRHAERVLDKARAWAIKESGDQEAATYDYMVSIKPHGLDPSILGVIEP